VLFLTRAADASRLDEPLTWTCWSRPKYLIVPPYKYGAGLVQTVLGNDGRISNAKGSLQLTTQRIIKPDAFSSMHILKSIMEVSIKLFNLCFHKQS